jgi:hypothetical protein
MAKYVLIQFDNDDDAEGFVGGLTTTNPNASVKVAGIFKKPTLFCECVPQEEKSARGAKWGWWICKKCGRCKKGQWQSPRNLLDPADILSKERTSFLQTHEPIGERLPTVTLIEPR